MEKETYKQKQIELQNAIQSLREQLQSKEVELSDLECAYTKEYSTINRGDKVLCKQYDDDKGVEGIVYRVDCDIKRDNFTYYAQKIKKDGTPHQHTVDYSDCKIVTLLEPEYCLKNGIMNEAGDWV